MLGPGRGNARPCIGALRMATSTLLFRGSTHVEEPTPHQMHQISDIPPAWFVSSVRASNLRGGRGSINFKRLLWLLLISQIAEMENARLQATPAAVPQSEVRFCRDSERESCCQYQAVYCRACPIVPRYRGTLEIIVLRYLPQYGRHRTVGTVFTTAVDLFIRV